MSIYIFSRYYFNAVSYCTVLQIISFFEICGGDKGDLFCDSNCIFTFFFFCLNYGFFNVFLKEKYPWLFTSGNVFIWAGDSCGEQLNPIAETTESCQFKIKAV